MFADDATILFSGETLDDDFQRNINRTVSTVVSWLKSINLKVNLTKTKLMQFRNHKQMPAKLNVMESGISIEEIENISFLGIIIDPHLTWKPHIQKINNKISSQCYALSILAETCSQKAVITAYYANIYSLLTYGVIYWGNSTDTQSTFVLQKKCLRIIFRMNNRQSLRNIFKDRGFLTLPCIYIYQLCNFVKCNKNYFTTQASLRDNLRTQYRYNLTLPLVKNKTYGKSTFISAIRVFNQLPNELKMLDDMKFKRNLKVWLIKNGFYSLKEFFDYAQN
jgi:hypothetical protein